MKSSTETDKILTVVVFKDRLSARSFQVSLSWVTRLGWTVFVTLLALTLVSLLALRFYFKIQSLEQDGSSGVRPIIAEKKVEEITSASNGQSGVSPTEPGILFRDFHPGVRFRESSAIQIEGVTLRYQGNFLNIRFNLRYTINDGGRQQGHFMIVARGSETLMTYPDGTLNLASDRNFFAPDRGEYFSVGKFREVEASFPAPRKQLTFKEVQVLIFNEEGHLIRLQQIPVVVDQPVKTALPRQPTPVPASISPENEGSNEAQ